MTKFQKQVEVQGTKKLDSVKGVQTLEINEMKETEGGFRRTLIRLFLEFIEDPTRFQNPNSHTHVLGHMGGGRP